MPGIGGMFGAGSVGQQLFVWGLLSNIVQTITAPGIAELAYLVNDAAPVNVLSPAELAELVNRGFVDHDTAAAEARKSGISGDRFTKLTDLAGQAPGPAELTEALRRGIIDENAPKGELPSFADGIRQGNLRNVWADLYRQLSVQLPSWQDALDALLEGQLPRDEALSWFTRAGGDPAAFQWLFDTRGSSPTPDMLGTMANRGIIGWDGTGAGATTFAQGFLEGPWRNKWEGPMRRLMEYHPPPRTVTAMLRSGALSEAEALTLFKQQGLSPELAAAYVKDATHGHAATSKALTQAQVESLQRDHLISADEAQRLLVALGLTPESARLLTSQVDLHHAMAQTNAAITRVRSLYLARKITRGAAADSLHTLGVNSAEAEQLLATWDVTRRASVKVLTEAQVVAAFHHLIITEAEAMAELTWQGYSAFDAWVLLSISNKAPLPNRPPTTVP